MEKKEIIFGRNPVLEYIKQINNPAGAVLYVSDSAHGKIIDTIVNLAGSKRVRTEFCGKDVLQGFKASARHQGVVLELPGSSEASGTAKDIYTFLRDVSGLKGVLVLLDQLTDPHNVGSIIRSAEALGAHGVVLTKAHSADVGSTVAKTSAGATAHLPVYTVPNAANFIESAKKAGFMIIGTSGEGETGPETLKGLRPSVIIIGSEGAGMRRLTEEKCDYIVKIPLRGRISSLNASVAAGIVIYEAMKE